MRKLLIVLTLIFANKIVLSQGDSCEAAIPMPFAANSVLSNNVLVGDQMWFTFVPQTSEVSIKLTNLNPTAGHIHDMMLIEGLCDPKFFIIEHDGSRNDTVLRINIHELVVGVPYFILVMRERAGCLGCVSGSALFDLQVQSLTPPVVTNSNNITYLNGEPSHVKNEIVLRINKLYLKMNAVDNTNQQDKPIPVFVQPGMIQKIANQVFDGDNIGLGQLHLKKVYPTLTSSDTISISRQGQPVRIPEFWETFILTIPDTMKIFRASRALSGINGIRYAEPNYVFSLQDVPNDNTYALNQPNLHPTATFPGAHINMEPAWDIEKGKSFVRVGVYDTGIDAGHPELNGGTVAGGFDYFTNSPNSVANDGQGHGTSCAGIIAAHRNNSNLVAGIAGGDFVIGNPGVSLIDIKVLSNQGVLVALATAANAILAGATSQPSGHGLHVMNISWAKEPVIATLYDNVQFADQNGVTIVCSRGNFPQISPIDKAVYPACYPDEMVLNIGASGIDGSWKTNGNGNTSDAGDNAFESMIKRNIDVIAPGTNALVRTTQFNASGITTFNGTSAAAPHVSGVAALMLSHVNVPTSSLNNLAIEDVENILQMSAIDKNDAGLDEKAGWGLLDAGGAMNKIKKPIYKIQHFGVGQNASATISQIPIATNSQIVLTRAFQALPQGIYYGDKYEVTITLNYNLSSPNDQIIASWPRPSSSLGWSASNPQNADNYCQVVSVTNTQAVLKTYLYNFLKDQNGQLLVDPWYPVQFGAKAALSIYTYDQTLIGIKELNPDGSQIFSIYPNPAKTHVIANLNLNSTQHVTVDIYDTQGKYIKNVVNNKVSEGKTTYDISLDSFSEGVYFFKVVTEKASYTQKFVVIK